MNIGQRKFKQFFKAIIGRQHYIAFLNMIIVCPDFLDFFGRYFFGRGNYPCSIKLRTPIKIVSPIIYYYFDSLTINEIFCRLDYRTNNKVKTVVDFGSNIGLSALYFLTRNNTSKCYLFEPVPENIIKLKDNLKDFSNRYVLREAAISNENGIKKFGTEEFGRCGGLLRESDHYIQVTCLNVNDVLKDILNQEEIIDILKIDTEGNEIDIINAIRKDFLLKIKVIFFEIDYTVNLDKHFKILSEYYHQSRYGNTIKLVSKLIFNG